MITVAENPLSNIPDVAKQLDLRGPDQVYTHLSASYAVFGLKDKAQFMAVYHANKSASSVDLFRDEIRLPSLDAKAA